MRFMILVPASRESEAGKMPTPEQLQKMHAFNEELVKAGVMLDGNGLQPSSKGARVVFQGKKTTVVDGPFAESKELVAGYWIWEVRSKEEAVEWLKRAPFGAMSDDPIAVEIRPLHTPEDFAASDPTGDITRREAQLRAQVASRG
jgi:hypothetical protein